LPGFEFGKKAKPELGSKTIDQYFKEYVDAGYDQQVALKLAQEKVKSPGASDDALDVINAQYGVPQQKYGGYMQEGGFVYADSIYPFIL
jgi:hypothetical protein